MHKIIIGALLVAVVQGLSACAVETSPDEEALADPAGQPVSDAEQAAPSGDDDAGSEGEPAEPGAAEPGAAEPGAAEPGAAEADPGEEQIVEKAPCGAYLNPKVSGGEAAWSVGCVNGVQTVSGWVKDTKADGKCARIKAVLPNGDVRYSKRACPKGTKHNFTFSGRGEIKTYLQVIK